MKSHLKHVFLFFYESTLPRNWNQSNRLIQTKVMAFSCQLVGLPILPRYRLQYLFFSALSRYLALDLCTMLNLGAKGSISTGITPFGAPKLKLRPKQLRLHYDQLMQEMGLHIALL